MKQDQPIVDVLFVGGPAGGKLKTMENPPPTFNCMPEKSNARTPYYSGEYPDFQYRSFTYKLMSFSAEIRPGIGRHFYFYVHESLSAYDMMRSLRNGYLNYMRHIKG